MATKHLLSDSSDMGSNNKKVADWISKTANQENKTGQGDLKDCGLIPEGLYINDLADVEWTDFESMI